MLKTAADEEEHVCLDFSSRRGRGQSGSDHFGVRSSFLSVNCSLTHLDLEYPILCRRKGSCGRSREWADHGIRHRSRAQIAQCVWPRRRWYVVNPTAICPRTDIQSTPSALPTSRRPTSSSRDPMMVTSRSGIGDLYRLQLHPGSWLEPPRVSPIPRQREMVDTLWSIPKIRRRGCTISGRCAAIPSLRAILMQSPSTVSHVTIVSPG